MQLNCNKILGRLGSTGFQRPTHITVTRDSEVMAIPASKILLPLENIVKSQYIPICWGQTSFSLTELSEMAFYKIMLPGRPLISMVWRHLNHLIQFAEYMTEVLILSFLSDLASTYDFLQDILP